jgi:hypothetical protein
MKAGGTTLRAVCGLLFLVAMIQTASAQTVADLQTRFDREPDAVHKVKVLEKLGNAQMEEARRAGKASDHGTVGLTMEKYRDNVRAALELLKKQHPNAEKQSDGYRHLEFQVRKGIREVDESLLMAPEAFKPPLQIVREDLNGVEEELLKLLFPRRPVEPPPVTPPAEKQP